MVNQEIVSIKSPLGCGTKKLLNHFMHTVCRTNNKPVHLNHSIIQNIIYNGSGQLFIPRVGKGLTAMSLNVVLMPANQLLCLNTALAPVYSLNVMRDCV